MGRWKPRPWHRRFASNVGAMGGGIGADVTAPSLSNAVDTAASPTTATLSVDTDEGNGTLYWVVTTSSSAPSAAQVKAGQDHNGSAASDSGSQAVAGTGTQSISGGATGLATGTFYAHFMHEDEEANQSTVASGDGFVLDLLVGETDGMATDFTESTGAGYVSVKDTATPANAVSNVSADSWWGNAGTSPKLVSNSSGVLGWSPHNLMPQSETLGTTWAQGAVTIGSNTVANPVDGAITADTIIEDGTSGAHTVSQNVSVIAGATYTSRVRLKAIGRTWVALRHNMGGTNRAYFDLANGVTGTVAVDLVSASITSLGNGWYDCSITVVADGTGSRSLAIELAEANLDNSFAGTSTDSVYAYGVQVNRGTVPTTYLATTTAARFGLGIDYANGSYGLLVEPAATNLALQSNDFATTWATNNSTIAANNATGPDGLTSADKLTESAGSALQNAYQSIAAFSSDTNYTLSVYAKAGTQSNIGIYLTKAGGGEEHIHATFNLATGATGETDVGTTSGTIASSSITSVGNGWYRCVLVGKITETTGYFGITPLASATGNTFDASGEVSYAGTGKTIFLWGAQMELGSVATSPIPTFTATVTRAADNISKALTALPFSATVGTVYAQFQLRETGTTRAIWGISDGTVAEIIDLLANTAANFQLRVRDNSGTVAGVNGGAISTSLVQYTAAWKANDVAISQDGAAIVADTAVTIPTVTSFAIGASFGTSNTWNGWIRKIIYVPRRVIDADLPTWRYTA